MEKIIETDNFTVQQEKSNIYTIKFKYQSYSLINSLLNTHIIVGGSTDEKYKTIRFKAESVKSLKQYQEERKRINCKKNLLVSDVAKIIRTLAKQLNYLIENESKTILGYNPEEIIIINDEKTAFLGSELIADICLTDELAMISCPYEAGDFFFSPELLQIKELPAFVHFKTACFSFALLIIYTLLADDEFYRDFLKHKSPSRILETLNNHPIKDTRIYWLLSRCLDEDPKKRSILYI